ncbi:TetR/AcrR family transcriptional regulator [Methanobacterium sp. CWC-01]|uniref:TetR/AcrR family transcriptional regulator n=1 Tax=Methanobacterium aridiramus TaxID=2584467 RepID=UPI002578A03A|nr:TetR/AcrR family transcriptional regulator [Methanobacterium sp. CWC-01]WJI09908.1 TetR/AcrR family transcriptional regulator [Methanobacterium sp. CWC-01]
MGDDFIRVTKSPEERHKELSDIAEQLFLEKGYEQTMVSDIVKIAGVAQGTFYYYFKSKEAVLDEITDKYISIIVESMEKISKDENLNPIEKLVKIFHFSLSFSGDTIGIMQYVHDEKNLHLQRKFQQRIPLQTVAPLAHIFKEGVEEGIFNTSYPEDAAKAFNGISGMVLQGIDSADHNPDEIKRKFMVIFDFVERILGTESGTISNAFREMVV